ncbi:MAG: M20/M25/M40 family metallo-hydrolase [Clostridia bacterium]|nr:M20/M25/M40 family metallo-hydrolase [Clostridia bacterium]
MECKKLFDCIDGLYEEYLSFWEKICNMETPTMNKALIDGLGEYFIDFAKQRGWETEVFESVTGNVVCLTMNADAKKEPITFSAHMDTVHPVGSFGSPAVTMDEEKIYGPGVVDCKGGLVAALLAMDALEKCNFRDRPVRFLLQSDEEAGSRPINKATIGYICEKAKDSRAFFNLEGSNGDSACVERKGIVTYLVKITGIEAHSSLCAVSGANAIAEAAHKILELEKFKDNDGITCTCGVISGGTTHNTVPGYCEFRANFRFVNNQQSEYIAEYMQKLAEEVYVAGCKTEAEEYGFRPAMERVQRNLDLLDTVNEIFAKNGMATLKPIKKNGGSDAAQVTTAGIPCLDSLGVCGGGIHSPNEYAIKTSLKESAKRLAAVIYCI